MPDDDYKFRYISAYRLAKSDLQDYLDRKFSPNESTEYFIELTPGDKYQFWIKRDLTKTEEQEILAMRKPAPPSYH